MTANEFRNLALSLPESVEAQHMGHPDFRVRNKIFATLGPEEKWGMVKLKPEQQAQLISERPEVFEPVKGSWGERGATIVQLKSAREHIVRRALVAAWRNTAPKRLVAEFADDL